MGTTITAADNQTILENLKMANTSYNIKAGLVVEGEPLIFQRDMAVVTNDLANSVDYYVTTPPGFQIVKVYNDATTGAQAFVAYNAATNTIKLGVSGIDGFMSDGRDTFSAVGRLAINQAGMILKGDDPINDVVLRTLNEKANNSGATLDSLLDTLKIEGGAQSMGANIAAKGVRDICFLNR